MKILYEDNHIIIVAKAAREIVQGDKTGDTPLSEMVGSYLKNRYNKPGNVFVGVVHRLDRPVSGVVMFAKTSKALARLNSMLQQRHIEKRYLAIVKTPPKNIDGKLTHYLVRNKSNNRSYAYKNEVKGSKLAILKYRLIGNSNNYYILDIELITGRHHQIRCQLSRIGSPIKGDLKYGAERSNPDGSISLHAYRIIFEHPVSHKMIDVVAPLPEENLWQSFSTILSPLLNQDYQSKLL
ncbi:MAG TPA: RluA family pseudouridine synthase [Bacteroidaceae bacterium]|nr:RluA family pseudouridine synthase [Bacteroidaceae bacterium]